MSKVRILLISPQFRIVKTSQSIYSKNALRRAQPLLGIGSIASSLKDRGYIVRYLDSVIEGVDNTFPFDNDTDCYGLGYDEISDSVRDFSPDVVGITCLFTSQLPQAIRIATDIKRFNKKMPIVIGGNHASLSFRDIMKYDCFDYVLKGEGEFIFSELIETILHKAPIEKVRSIVYKDNGTIKETEGFERIMKLDKTPYLDWDLVPLKKYWENTLPQNPFSKSKKVIPYETSRGCPERCIFCSTSQFFGHRFRPKSAKRVIEELKRIKRRYDIEEVQFSDDNMALDTRRLIEICEGLEDLKLYLCSPNGIRLDYIKDDDKVRDVCLRMKRANFYQVSFAPESGNEYILNNVIRKRLDLNRMKRLVGIVKDCGIKVHAFFMVGLPYETREQIDDTISYANGLGADSYSFSIATPFPGTKLWSWCEKENLFKEGFKESDLIFGKSVLRRFDSMTPGELELLTERVAAELNNRG